MSPLSTLHPCECPMHFISELHVTIPIVMVDTDSSFMGIDSLFNVICNIMMSIQNIVLKMSSAKWRPLFFGANNSPVEKVCSHASCCRCRSHCSNHHSQHRDSCGREMLSFS